MEVDIFKISFIIITIIIIIINFICTAPFIHFSAARSALHGV